MTRTVTHGRAAGSATVLSLVACAAGLGGACLAGAARRLGDFDLPWHLATGRAIWLSRGLPDRDDFSYTFRGAPVRCEPLSDLSLYLVERLGGAPGLQLLALALLALLCVLMLARASGRSPGSRLAGAALAALALVAAGPWLVVRPALLSFPLLAGELLLIDRHRRGGRDRLLAGMVAVQLAWANCHGSAPLGAAVAVGYAGYALGCRLARGRVGALLPAAEGRRAPAALAGAAAATIATALCPSGLSIFAEPFRVWTYGEWVTEWAPTTWSFLLRNDPPLLVLIGLTLLALLGSLRRPASERPSLFDLGLSLGTLALAASRVRLIPFFAFAAAPLVARLVAPWVERARLLPAAAVTVMATAAPALLVAPGARLGLGWDGENLPLGAVAFAAAHRLAGPLWNFLPFGGWVAWRLHPETRVFIDGRTAKLYPDAFLAEYRRGGRDRGAFAALQRSWGFAWALVRARPGERFDQPLADDAGWALVYLDDSAAIYVRRDGPDAAQAAGAYRVLRHLTPAPLLFFQLTDRAHPPSPDLLASVDHDAALAVEQAPASPRAWLLAATSAIARGDRAAATLAHRRLEEIDPHYEGTRLVGAALAAPE